MTNYQTITSIRMPKLNQTAAVKEFNNRPLRLVTNMFDVILDIAQCTAIKFAQSQNEQQQGP